MTGHSPFGARLWLQVARRPAAHPEFAVFLDQLAADLEVAGSELDAVLHDASPSSTSVHRLAPRLGLHAADLFVIAGLPLPLDLAPANTPASADVGCPLDVMVAVAGIGPVVPDLPAHPASADPAELAGHARRLDRDQNGPVRAVAGELRSSR